MPLEQIIQSVNERPKPRHHWHCYSVQYDRKEAVLKVHTDAAVGTVVKWFREAHGTASVLTEAMTQQMTIKVREEKS